MNTGKDSSIMWVTYGFTSHFQNFAVQKPFIFIRSHLLIVGGTRVLFRNSLHAPVS